MSLYWCWTLNNYTEDDEAEIEFWDVEYTVYGREIGENGTRHLQGYTEFKCKKRLSTLKNLHRRVHWEARKGTQEQAIQYCLKEQDSTEYGRPRENHRGFRSDLDKIRKTALESGMREVTCIGNQQQIAVAKAFLTYNEPERDFKPTVIWLWGEPGVGKSRRARENVNLDDCYTKNTNTKWWDGYDGHENVIIDDYRKDWWDTTYMLGLIDRYEFKLEIKGGMRQMLAKRIIITSTSSPEDIEGGWPREVAGQLIRRIDYTEHIVPIVPEVAEG